MRAAATEPATAYDRLMSNGSQAAAIRPPRLRPGDTIAVVSPSWGGPAAFPAVFERGLDALRSFGLEVREMPSTRAPHADPPARAADVNAAFADPSIRGVVAAIGGDDSIRLLPHFDQDVIASNPKVFVGYSDTVTTRAALRSLGLVAFHGPSVMAGFAQMQALEDGFADHVRSMLFEVRHEHVYQRYETVVHGYRSWRDPASVGLTNPPERDDGPHLLQGSGRVTGELFGGCLEVLDWIRGTWAWPSADDWRGRLLFVEPSEDKPTPTAVARILRSFAAVGVFDGIVGLMVGRPRDHDDEERAAFEAAIVDVVAEELGRSDLPVVANLPFGHTDPQWILPIGVRAALDADDGSVRLVEPWLA